jgi:hypothetical protein
MQQEEVRFLVFGLTFVTYGKCWNVDNDGFGRQPCSIVEATCSVVIQIRNRTLSTGR